VHTETDIAMLIFQRRRQGRESDLLSAGRGRCFACRSCVLTIGWLTTLFPNILPPPCLRYNLLNPKPTLITFGNNYNKMRILFPFTVALCTLTSARSMSIQFWLKFTVENKKRSDLKIKSNHWRNAILVVLVLSQRRLRLSVSVTYALYRISVRVHRVP